MERFLKNLQITALVVALLAPWIYFVGYAYDWGYLNSFSIEHEMFFKSPQEYFGLAYVVFIEIATKIIGAVPNELVVVVCLFIATFAIVVLAIGYWVHRSKSWSRFYLWCSNWLLRKRGIITLRFVRTVAAPAYLISAFPLLLVGGAAYLLLLFISPGVIGYSKGQEDANKLKEGWHPDTCTTENIKIGCTQLFEAGKVVAVGKLVAISDKFAAIFDGNSVQIYSLHNRDMKTILKLKTPASK